MSDELIPKCGIYKIVNTVTGNFYIGSSKDIEARWFEHKKRLRRNRHENEYLQNSWNKYGEFVFAFSILELCSLDNLLQVEQEYIDTFWDCKVKCFNISTKAGSGPGPKIGTRHSEETKEKQALGLKGNKNALGVVRSQQFKAALSKANIGENNNNAKLTWAIVNDIRAKALEGTSAKDLSILYKVHYWTIVRIIKHETWR